MTAAGRRNALVFVADANIFPAAAFAANRAATLNDRSDVDILVFTDSAADIERANTLTLPFAVRRMPPLPTTIVQPAYYQRFFIFDTLTEAYRRVLYLDVDTYIQNATLFGVFDLPMGGHVFAGVRDGVVAFVPGPSELIDTLGPGNTKYLNTGVLLVDAPRYGADRILSRMVTLVREHGRPFFHRDQSALNRLLHGEWLELSPAFNLFGIQWDTFVARVCDPVVVHFAGPGKPWRGPRFTLDHPARAEMERFFPHSPWRDFLPRFFTVRDALDPALTAEQRNFDMDFRGKAEFVRYLRDTEFADVAAGLTTLHREHLPPL